MVLAIADLRRAQVSFRAIHRVTPESPSDRATDRVPNSASNPATFTMLCCAHGAEAVVKKEIADQDWRLAFSRPGFVTAKHDGKADLPEGVFIRTASSSIGQARGESANELITEMIAALRSAEGCPRQFDQLHVWPKDRLPIGKFGFEPGTDEVSASVADAILQQFKSEDSDHPLVRCDAANKIAQPGESVLDVVLIEPSHWFFGHHTARTWPSQWPGGVQPISPLEEPISRAYYKAAEAITWSGFEMHPGDLVVEIGSAPGGVCGRLLELGMKVIGVDPAEMDPEINEHPNFRHIVARAHDLPRVEYKGAKWLLVDSNVRPDQTLITVENIVTHRHSDFRGLLLTLKIGDYIHADRIDGWLKKIAGWNPSDVRVRQLARNKCEVCIAVTL